MATYGKGEFGGFSSYQTGDSPRTTGKQWLVKIHGNVNVILW